MTEHQQHQPAPLDTEPLDTGRRRVHPITPIVKSFTLFAAVIAYVLLNVWQGVIAVFQLLYDMAWLGVALGLLVLLAVVAVIVLISWLSWRYMFYQLADGEVRYGTGWLIRSRRSARLDRVQAVDINQPLLARIVGLAEIIVETAGGRGSRFKIQYLPLAECQAFRAEILREVEKLDTGLAGELYRQAEPADTSAALLADDAAARPAAPGLDPNAKTIYGPVEPKLLLAAATIGPGLFLGIATVIAAIVAAFFSAFLLEALAGIGIGSIITIAVTVVSAFLAATMNWGFTLKTSSKSRRLAITAGLLSTRSQTIPIDRVHGIKITQPLWWRPWKWSKADVSVAGYDVGEGSSHDTLVPIAPDAQVADIATYLLSEIAGPDSGADGKAGAPLGIWRTPRRAWWLSPIDWKFQEVVATRQGLRVASGRFWHIEYVVPWQRIQGHTLLISPFSKAAGVATVRVDMVPGTVTPVAAQLDLADAYSLAAIIERHKVV